MKTTRRTNTFFSLSKLIIHHALCWSLILWQAAPTSTFAEQSRLDGAGKESDKAPATTVSQGGEGSGDVKFREVGDGGKPNPNVQKIEGNDVDAKGNFLWSNIGLFAAAAAAPMVIARCSNAYSTWVYGASAAIYLLNEIGLFTRFNKASNQEMAAYLHRGDEDKQIDSLKTAAKQTRKAKEAAKRRAMISKIAAAGFGVAAVMAALEESMGWYTGNAACTGSIDSQDSLQTPLEPVKLYADVVPNPTPTFGLEAMNLKDTHSYIEASEGNTGAMIAYKDSIRFLNGEVISTSVEDFENFKTMEFEGFEVKSLLSQSLALFIPSAHAEQPAPHEEENSKEEHASKDEQATADADADKKEEEERQRKINKEANKMTVNQVGGKLAATGLGAAAGGLIMTQAPTLAEYVTKPMTRAVGFGAFAVTGFMAATESDEAANKLDQRAREYDRLADSLKNQSLQETGIDPSGGEQFINGTTQDIGGDGVGISNNAICGQNTGGGDFKVDETCACRAKDNCKGPSVPNIKELPDFNGKTLLTESLDSLSAAGKDVFAGRLKGAKTSGETLTNNAARITKLRKGIQKAISDRNVKNGGQPLDFDKAEDAFRNRMENDIKRAFDNLSDAEQRKLAGFGAGFGALGGGDKVADDDKDKAKKSDAAPAKVAAVDVNPNAGSRSDKTADGAVWDFDFEDDAAAEQAAIEEALKAKEDENYVVTGDISEDRNKNLFNIITKRYLKTAYPVIFEEE